MLRTIFHLQSRSLFLDRLPSPDAQACLESCRTASDCAFFTHYYDDYDAGNNECILFADCQEFAEGACAGGGGADGCATGSVDCADLVCSAPGNLSLSFIAFVVLLLTILF